MPFKLRKEFLPDLNLLLRNFTLIFVYLSTLLLLILPIQALGTSSSPFPAKNQALVKKNECLHEPTADKGILLGLDFLFQMDYARADSVFNTIPVPAARAYFRGLGLVNRYNDLGDTAALTEAESYWTQLLEMPKPNGNFGLYQGLAELQLGYAAGLRGHKIRSAKWSRSGVSKLRAFPGMAEAKAGIALYEYYKASILKGMAWIPFTQVDAATPLADLQKAIPQSRYLHQILQTSLLWLFYDRGQYQEGLLIIDTFLAQYPENRLYRQIKADFHFRKGEVKKAQDIHLALLDQYQILNKSFALPRYIPIGYLSSVGNLAKIFAALGQKQILEAHLKIWNAKEFEGTMAWLPISLKNEVQRLK